jgi:hypothetical protein
MEGYLNGMARGVDGESGRTWWQGVMSTGHSAGLGD